MAQAEIPCLLLLAGIIGIEECVPPPTALWCSGIGIIFGREKVSELGIHRGERVVVESVERIVLSALVVIVAQVAIGGRECSVLPSGHFQRQPAVVAHPL